MPVGTTEKSFHCSRSDIACRSRVMVPADASLVSDDSQQDVVCVNMAID